VFRVLFGEKEGRDGRKKQLKGLAVGVLLCCFRDQTTKGPFDECRSLVSLSCRMALKRDIWQTKVDNVAVRIPAIRNTGFVQ